MQQLGNPLLLDVPSSEVMSDVCQALIEHIIQACDWGGNPWHVEYVPHTGLGLHFTSHVRIAALTHGQFSWIDKHAWMARQPALFDAHGWAACFDMVHAMLTELFTPTHWPPPPDKVVWSVARIVARILTAADMLNAIIPAWQTLMAPVEPDYTLIMYPMAAAEDPELVRQQTCRYAASLSNHDF